MADNEFNDRDLRQAFWEIPKALTMLAVGCGVFMGFVLAGIGWLHPPPPAPQQITATIHLAQPLVVHISPAPR